VSITNVHSDTELRARRPRGLPSFYIAIICFRARGQSWIVGPQWEVPACAAGIHCGSDAGRAPQRRECGRGEQRREKKPVSGTIPLLPESCPASGTRPCGGRESPAARPKPTQAHSRRNRHRFQEREFSPTPPQSHPSTATLRQLMFSMAPPNFLSINQGAFKSSFISIAVSAIGPSTLRRFFPLPGIL
jgi:hypothetical protein